MLNWGAIKDSPQWLDHKFRQTNYPSDQFYQGFVSRSFSSKEDRLQVENEIVSQSRIRLAESFHVTITSLSTSTLSNVNSESVERFEQQSVTRTDLKASGLETLTFFDERKKVAYAFSYIKKRRLQSIYLRNLRDQMISIQDRIRGYADSSPPYNVLNELVDDLEKVKVLQNTLAFTGISAAVLRYEQWNKFKDWASEHLDKLREAESIGLEQAAIFIRDGLLNDINIRAISDVKINRMTYKNTGIASELSVLFAEYFEDVMAQKFNIVSENHDWVVNSTYWPLNDKIKITTTIHQESDNELVRLIASTSVKADRDLINRLGIDYEPLKTQEDEAKHQTITENEPVGEILVDLTTQKGDKSLVFREGDPLQLMVKVSRPAYVQLINVWADGSKLLLLDNYFIDISQVNRFVELPFEWETSCPCGVEYIYAIAGTDPHKAPITDDKDGLLFITDPISDVIKNLRGPKEISNEKVSGTSIILSTMQPK